MASVRVQQTKCPECSASLEIKADAESTRCAYCGTTLHVEHKRAPRNPTQVQPATIYVPPPMPIAARLGMFLGPIIPIIIVGTQLWPMIRGYVPVLGNQLPAECGMNGRVSIRGKTHRGAGTLIRATAVNCTVVLKDCDLEADTIIEGGINTTIELDHSKLVARKRAIQSGVNTKLRAVNGSEIRGERVALDLATNADVRLEDSAVRSPGVAIKADANLSLDADGGAIEGGTAAIQAGGWTQKLDLSPETKVIGARHAKTSR
jgi:hypothetical protein